MNEKSLPYHIFKQPLRLLWCQVHLDRQASIRANPAYKSQGRIVFSYRIPKVLSGYRPNFLLDFLDVLLIWGLHS